MMQIVQILKLFDRALLVDRPIGWINWPSTEYMSRKAQGVELSFPRCKKESDWYQGPNAPKRWQSKVYWRSGDKVDSDGDGSVAGTDFKVEPLDDEVKVTTYHKALMMKSQAKLLELTDKPRDRFNREIIL